jgi:hypothetical protein
MDIDCKIETEMSHADIGMAKREVGLCECQSSQKVTKILRVALW